MLMKRAHRERGFAYTPHNRPPIDGDITYGDTSMTVDFIRERWLGWEVTGVDYNLQDPFQLLVYLRPIG